MRRPAARPLPPAAALALALLLALPAASLAAWPGAAPKAPGFAGDLSIPLDVPLPDGLSAKIYRDTYGVPHVFADTEYALFYANGYVQAQDRLFAMDALRHVGEGDAASVLGPGLLGSDFTVRRELYTTEQRLAKFLALPAEGQMVLQAFADGVNRDIAEATATGHLPAEFVALNHAPEPWTVLDTVAVADFLLDRFGTGGGGEVGNAQLLAQLQSAMPAGEAERAFGDLVWDVHPGAYSTIPGDEARFTLPVPHAKPLAQLAPAQAQALAAAERAQPFGVPQSPLPPLDASTSFLPGFDPQRIKWGSNAVLIAPERSRTGQAMVGGGPQTGYFNPEILYEVGLHGAGWDVVGVGVMGAPGVVLGRTGTFAWTVTSGFDDETDTVALPAAGARNYTWDGQVRPLDCRQEIHVAVNPPALGAQAPQVWTQEVCSSHLGPVTAWTLDANGNPTWFFTEHKAHRLRELTGAMQWLGLGRAKNLTDFRAAFDGFPFTFNFNYAGPEGACYHHVGILPVRNAGLDPRFPTPPGEGWNWTGEYTGAQFPRLCNPEQGYFVNWNNLPEQGWPAGDNREIWGSVNRVDRLDREVRRALDASPDGKLDLPQLQEALHQAAIRDPLAPRMVRAWLEVAPDGPARDALQAWADRDFPWADADGDGVYDDPGHAYYDAIRIDLQHRAMDDELGPFAREWNPDPMTSDDPHAADHGRADNKDVPLFDAFRGTAAHNWCDDVRTPQVESCAQLLAASVAAVGPQEPAKVHRSPFSPIGAGPAYTMPMTNRATYFHFHVGTDTGRSVSAIPPGESGHLELTDLASVLLQGGQGPVHMHDQLPLYERFMFKILPVTEAQAAAVSGPPETLVVPPPGPVGTVPLPALPALPELPVGLPGT